MLPQPATAQVAVPTQSTAPRSPQATRQLPPARMTISARAALPRAFPFRNGFADSGRQGLTAIDRGRQQDPFWPVFMLVNGDFPR
jgi:hypothetical protein